MAEKLRSRDWLVLLSGLFILLSTLVLFLPLENVAKFFLIASGAVFLFSLINYRWGFFIFLFIRPLIDFATEQKLFSVGSVTVNLLFVYGGLMLLFSLLVLGANYQELKEKKIRSLWLVFIFWSLISLSYSFDLFSSVKELSRYLSIFFSFALGAILIKKSGDLTRLIKVIIFSSLIPALVALSQYIYGNGLIEDGINRLYGTMAHPNMLAFYLLLPITLSVFIFLTVNKKRVEAYLYLAIALFLSFILVYTYTRGAYVALLLIFILIGLLKYRKFLAVAGVGLILFYVASTTFQQRFNTIFQADPSGSISWRISLYRDSLSYVMVSPIIGQGVGLAETVIAANRDFRLGATQPHNDYIRLALDGGIIGVVIYLLLIAALFFELIKLYKLENRVRLKMLNIFILAFTVSLYAMSIGDNILNDTTLEWQFWALIGGLLATQVIKKPVISERA